MWLNWMLAALLAALLTLPAAAQEGARSGTVTLSGTGQRLPDAPPGRVRVVTEPVVITTPQPARYSLQPLICTSVYGTAICQCWTKCVATRNDCRCED